MNREIKFRAIHKPYKDKRSKPPQMLYNIESTYDNVNGDSFGDFLTDKFHLMQFVGFSDIEGTRVYEGDVLEILITPLRGKKYVHREVVYHHVGNEDGDFVSGFVFSYNEPHKMKVIGNIHENPELLK